MSGATDPAIKRQVTALRETLRSLTTARVGLERAGEAIATGPQLEFQLDHAAARDAVHAKLDVERLLRGLADLGLRTMALRSAVPSGDGERATYLRRPDLGRRLDAASTTALQQLAPLPLSSTQVVFCIADGLSALAMERHALPLLSATLPKLHEQGWEAGPACVISQGRVAVGDEIGGLLGVKVMVMLIGERPGLSAADSLGVYITWQPRSGRSDAERNCISNVRAQGLSYDDAADRILLYLNGARLLGATGVNLRLAQPSLPSAQQRPPEVS